MDSPELHGTDDSRQGKEEEGNTEQENGFSRFGLLLILSQD